MGTPHVIIREAQIPDDFQEIIHLWKSAGPGIHLGESDNLAEIKKKQLRDPDFFLIAEVEGQVVGSVLGGFDGRRGIVYHLVVSNPFRKLGIGDRLMTELEARLHLKGCIRSYLLVTQDNQDAVDFYLKRGWNKLDLFVMGKDIE
jgi:ribosomal protein S18 acetylase RimI-like enzyme